MNINELKLAINNEIKDAQATISILIENLDTKEFIYNYNEDITVVSASMIKVPIMLTALEMVQEGLLNTSKMIEMSASTILEDSEVFEYGAKEYSLEELLIWMIINSDNSATNCLIDLLSMERINEFCKRYSLSSTKVERKMLDFEAVEQGRNNYTSAHDMNILFHSLYHKTILTADLCDYAISILKRQRHKQVAMRYICDDIVVAHKTGELDCLNHDAGIFYLREINYYFGAFVSEAPSNDYAMRLIGRISKLVYEYYKNKH